MADITLISGSTLGGAEYVAEHLAEKLEDAGFSTQTLHGPLLEDLPTDGVWLVITSTHGAGDLPDNLQPLYDELLEQQPDLSNVRFGAVGIGSREYDTFCGAIEKVEAAVIEKGGAKRMGTWAYSYGYTNSVALGQLAAADRAVALVPGSSDEFSGLIPQSGGLGAVFAEGVGFRRRTAKAAAQPIGLPA